MGDASELVFGVTWYDELGCVDRPYTLTVFEYPDGAVEVSLYDVKNRRMFLKKSPYKGLRVEDLYQGAKVTVHARVFKVAAYGNDATKGRFTQARSLVTALVPPHCYADFGTVLTLAQRGGFSISKLKTLPEPGHEGGVALAVELVGSLGGAQSPDELWQAVFRGSSEPCAREVQLKLSGPDTAALFSGNSTTAAFDSCALLVVKPHAVREGVAGQIVSALIDANFQVSCMQLFNLSRTEAENLTEVYDGVINPSEYAAMTLELSSGPLLAIEVRAENAVDELRQLVGPADYEVAKQLRPNTLRARFGKSAVHNAIHCTDLPEDGQLESSFFFDVLLNQAAHAN
jgi:nucleoside-diphosphate kinase